MAILYVKSGTAGTATPYATIDTAAVSLEIALDDAACDDGSTIYVDAGHTLVSASNLNYSTAGVITIISADFTTASDSNTIPGSILNLQSSAGADERTSGANDLSITSSQIIAHGVSFQSSDVIIFGADSRWEITGGTFGLIGTSSGDYIRVRADDASLRLQDLTLNFGNAGQEFQLSNGALLDMQNVTLSGTGPDGLIGSVVSQGGHVTINGLDASTIGSGQYLINALPASIDLGVLRFYASNIKLGHASAGVVNAPFAERKSSIEVYNVDEIDTTNMLHVENICGVATTDTSNYLDATNAASIKMVSTTSTREAVTPFRVLIAEFYADAAATVKTNVIHEAQGAGTEGDLLDTEFWLEVSAVDGTTGSLGKWFDSLPADIISGGGDLSNNGESWTEVLTGEVTQEASITLTGSGAGPVQVWACLASAAGVLTVYVDSKVVVT